MATATRPGRPIDEHYAAQTEERLDTGLLAGIYTEQESHEFIMKIEEGLQDPMRRPFLDESRNRAWSVARSTEDIEEYYSGGERNVRKGNTGESFSGESAKAANRRVRSGGIAALSGLRERLLIGRAESERAYEVLSNVPANPDLVADSVMSFRALLLDSHKDERQIAIISDIPDEIMTVWAHRNAEKAMSGFDEKVRKVEDCMSGLATGNPEAYREIVQLAFLRHPLNPYEKGSEADKQAKDYGFVFIGKNERVLTRRFSPRYVEASGGAARAAAGANRVLSQAESIADRRKADMTALSHTVEEMSKDAGLGFASISLSGGREALVKHLAAAIEASGDVSVNQAEEEALGKLSSLEPGELKAHAEDVLREYRSAVTFWELKIKRVIAESPLAKSVRAMDQEQASLV